MQSDATATMLNPFFGWQNTSKSEFNPFASTFNPFASSDALTGKKDKNPIEGAPNVSITFRWKYENEETREIVFSL